MNFFMHFMVLILVVILFFWNIFELTIILIYDQYLKNNFIIIYRHLLFIANHIVSLHLSEKDDTPGQIDEFYAYGFTLRQFIDLQSLSLYYLRSLNSMNKILLDLSYLSNISHLTLEKCYFTFDKTDASTLIDIIWS